MSDFDYSGDDLEALSVLRNYQAWVVDSFLPRVRGRVVEYGAGLGSFSAHFLPNADYIDLVEPSSSLIGKLHSRFSEHENVGIVHASLESHIASVADASVDTVIMINVLEHIEDDAGALAGIHRVLAPGGHLLIFVPALRWLFSELDRRVGHHRRYHLKDLVALVEGAGFNVGLARYMDVLGVWPWWVMNTLGGSTAFNPRLVALYDRVGVPLTRGIESLMNPPLGKNVILAASRSNDMPRPIAGRL